ncbi:transglutaminase-like domain-containing protein [bacterium]|nr:transglutaminase-like domain-containing protein [bacterium]
MKTTTKDDLLTFLRRDDLMRASLVLGRIEDPRFNLNTSVDALLSIAARVWHLSGGMHEDSIVMVHTINKVLYDELGLQVSADRSKRVMDDPKRYLLHEVLDRKVGSPLTMAILYSILCEQVGVPHECIAIPGNFLIRILDSVDDFYVDPFDQGRLMNATEFQKKFRSTLQRNRMMQTNLFEKAGGEQLVSRLAHQLKQTYVLKGKALEALQTVEILTALHPESPELARDRGILYCEMEYFSKAMDDLKSYLKKRPQADDVADIKKLTTMLKGYREIVN